MYIPLTTVDHELWNTSLNGCIQLYVTRTTLKLNQGHMLFVWFMNQLEWNLVHQFEMNPKWSYRGSVQANSNNFFTSQYPLILWDFFFLWPITYKISCWLGLSSLLHHLRLCYFKFSHSKDGLRTKKKSNESAVLAFFPSVFYILLLRIFTMYSNALLHF